MDELTRFARRLVEQLSSSKDGVHRPVAIGVVRETILPYRKHRAALGIDSVEDYETVLLRLVAGERGYVKTVPAEAAERCRSELAQPNPDLSVLDEVAESTVQITSMAAAQIVGDDPEPIAAPEPPRASTAKPLRVARPPAPAPAAPVPAAVASPAPIAATEPAAAPAPAPVVQSTPPVAASPAAPPPPAPTPPSRPEKPPMAPESKAPDPSACTHPVPDGRQVVFCPWCGVRLIPFTCPRCQTELDSAWRHCITCGAPVKDPFRYS